MAFSFLGFIACSAGMALFMQKARENIRRYRFLLAFACLLGACLLGSIALNWTDRPVQAAPTGLPTGTFTPGDAPNQPKGVARGLVPGRVVWCQDTAATLWDGSSNYWYSSQNTDLNRVKNMLKKNVMVLAGSDNISVAWDRLFRFNNKSMNGLEAGYKTGEKIAIKINLNNNFNGNQIDASPHLCYALLDQLVNIVGVAQSDITLYDAQRTNITPVKTYCQSAFPNVKYNETGGWIANQIFYSSEITDSNAKRLPACLINARYLINMAILKRHCRISSSWSDSDGQTGVTLCAKSHFGTCGSPSALHNTIRDWDPARGMGKYNALVDLIGHKQTNGKTVLHIIDGLYAGDYWGATAQKWKTLGNHWPSSILVSQDPVAIDSVGMDFLRAEWGLVANADNYLHEAAQAGNPPSGIKYAPNGDGVRLSSLGAHEHWNNAVDRRYSRNLQTGQGIELVQLISPLPRHGSADRPDTRLKWSAAATGCLYDVYFGSDSSQVINATTSSQQYQGRQNTTSFNPPDLKTGQNYYWRVDILFPGGMTIKGDVWRFNTNPIRREVWTSIGSGSDIPALTSLASYINNQPSQVDYLSSFEAPQNWANEYGTRIEGLLVIPQTGSYTFRIAGDDNCELWLSMNDNPSGVSLIARVPGWTSFREWEKFPADQKSAPLSLTAGQVCFIRALQKEGTERDSLSVAWGGPGIADKTIIDSSYMRPLSPAADNEPARFTARQLVLPPAAENIPYSCQLIPTISNPDNDDLTFSLLAGSSWLKIIANHRLSGTPGLKDVGTNTFTVQVQDNHGNIDQATVVIEVANKASGVLGLPDLKTLAPFWLTTTSSPDRISADLNNDDHVDMIDLSILSQFWNLSPQNGLLAGWPMNDTAGSTCRDTCLNHPGTLVNMNDANWQTSSQSGCLYFDGQDDYVDCGKGGTINNLSDFSVSMWFEAGALPQGSLASQLICQRDLTRNLWCVYLHPTGGGILGGAVLTDNQMASSISTFSPSPGTWYHLVMTYSNAGDRLVRLHINGAPINYTTFQPATGGRLIDGQIPVVIGNRFGGDRPFSGRICHVNIFNRILTASEIYLLSLNRQN